MDIFLVVTTCIILVVLGVVGVYLLVHFSHPDDKNEAYLPKAVVLFGFVLASAMVLLLPLDVVNKDGYAGKLLSHENAALIAQFSSFQSDYCFL